MITIQKTLDLPDTYPLKRLGPKEELLFFDIETTGLSGDYSNLYLIGCTYFENGSWRLIQWFADKKKEEPKLLTSFFQFMERFTVLIHFNGDGFDIPYLQKRCAFYKLPYHFSDIRSIDIYKKIRPYKQLLKLDNLKQKTIELFLGVNRDDMCSGGQLIDVYKEYLITHEKMLYNLLILHNEDDLKGMPGILPILCYPDFFEHEFHLLDQQISGQPKAEAPNSPGSLAYRLALTFESEYEIPRPVSCHREEIAVEAEKRRMEISIPLLNGTLKFFYPNYKDYYYLTYEDTAIHKSVAQFVDKEARERATPDTCYTKQEGCFLPQFGSLWEPAMRRERKDKQCYIEFKPSLFEDKKRLSAYLSRLLVYVCQNRKK